VARRSTSSTIWPSNSSIWHARWRLLVHMPTVTRVSGKAGDAAVAVAGRAPAAAAPWPTAPWLSVIADGT
jgi:hypothetical protein